MSFLLFFLGYEYRVREAGPSLLWPRAGGHEGRGQLRQGQVPQGIPGCT